MNDKSSEINFRVDQIDHVELTVPNRHDAAIWYQNVLGLEIVSEFEFWADDDSGPLMIATAGGTKLALFQGPAVGSQPEIGIHLIAFRVDADGFLQFLSQLQFFGLLDSDGQIVTVDHVRDHQRAFSIYFCDPWGNPLELTTYDHQTVRRHLQQTPD